MTIPTTATSRTPATNNRAADPAGRTPRRERAVLVQLKFPGTDAEAQLEELRLLALSAGAEVAGAVLGRRERPDAATYIGRGKSEEVRDAVAAAAADLVLVNHELSPSQERNLEKVVGCRVLDRTGLILDIFAQRAHSHEGKLQVELAQLDHLATRLVRGWTHLERQKGGIGLRGPGETQLETDRRLIRERVKHLNRRLEKVRAQRGSRRKARRKIPIPTVSLVGYTNAGKSSLFNRLTGAEVYAADQLFATLDPTMRRIALPGNTSVILADTVGFIRHLPHKLVEAFKSTLEEVAQAELLLHVVDAASPERREHAEQVNAVLREIHAETVPQITIFNKIDLTGDAPRVERDESGRVSQIWLSAATGAGVELLREALAGHYRHRRFTETLRLPPAAGRLHALIHARLHVVRETIDTDGAWRMEIELEPAQLDWLMQTPDFEPAMRIAEPAPGYAETGS
ncbi:MAG TPA: ribosome rescue GTPase HflX [Acidiferrobacterales bacterium]